MGQSSCNDFTCFWVLQCGCLVETALFDLAFSWWKFLEEEFPLDPRVTLSSLGLLELIYCAVSLSVQARDTALQEKEDEYADSNLRRVTV